MLKIEQLSVGYGPLEVLHALSFEAPARSTTAILGANGAGKTTLMRALTGQLRQRQGTIALEGHPIENLSIERRVQHGIALVPEGRELFGSLTVRENLLMGGFIRRSHKETEASLERVLDYFPRLKIHLSAQAASLSGGEGQMLAIGRALMSQPRLLLLDEPVAGMGLEETQDLAAVMLDIKEQLGITQILVEHDMAMVMGIADRILVLDFGRVIARGTPAEIQANPEVIKAYLGAEAAG